MTREGLIKHWDVICAFKDGAKIQWRPASADNAVPWVDIDNLAHDFTELDEYRIKPEPREWWAVKYGLADRLYCDEGLALQAMEENRGVMTVLEGPIHVREVIE